MCGQDAFYDHNYYYVDATVVYSKWPFLGLMQFHIFCKRVKIYAQTELYSVNFRQGVKIYGGYIKHFP